MQAFYDGLECVAMSIEGYRNSVLKKTRAEALEAGDQYYLKDKPCSRGHRYLTHVQAGCLLCVKAYRQASWRRQNEASKGEKEEMMECRRANGELWPGDFRWRDYEEVDPY